MWIERFEIKKKLVELIPSLKQQVLFLRGARQTGKTSFIFNALETFTSFSQVKINLSFAQPRVVRGHEVFGREYFGSSPDASQLIRNLTLKFGDLKKLNQPILIFIDEADHHPVSLEAVQELADLSEYLKVIYTGSNLENIVPKNAATGRKLYLDLYPISFEEFLIAFQKKEELAYYKSIDAKDFKNSEFYHSRLLEIYDQYLRLGGMPKVMSCFLDAQQGIEKLDSIPSLISDLVSTIEENIKSVLGDKFRFFEFEDVLRKIALLSMDTLKFSRLQINHASRIDAKKLVNKTVGARVAHKIRLFVTGSDLSKYILFDCGVLNYLLNGSDLLNQKITSPYLAIQNENFVGIELIRSLPTRDDLGYWKSDRGAQVEYVLKSPLYCAIDVKSTRGDTKSLQSCAIFEPELECLVKLSRENPKFFPNFEATLPNHSSRRGIPLLTLPIYCAGRLREILGNCGSGPGSLIIEPTEFDEFF